MRKNVTTLVLSVALLFLAPAFAADSADASAIRHLIKSQWDKPREAVTVDPIVIEQDVAIADWTQGERGGRALLRRSDSGWRVVLCGGDALKQATALEETGMAAAMATSLEHKLAEAEAGVSADRLERIGSFEGVMRMESEGHDHAQH